MIIREVRGMSWGDYLKDSLLIPAGLTHTSPFVSDYAQAELAPPYVYSGPGRALDHKKDTTMHAAGGLITTTGDMAKWLRLMINRTPDDPEKLYIENTTAGYLVRYEDYGVFRVVRP